MRIHPISRTDATPSDKDILLKGRFPEQVWHRRVERAPSLRWDEKGGLRRNAKPEEGMAAYIGLPRSRQALMCAIRLGSSMRRALLLFAQSPKICAATLVAIPKGTTLE
jgi:hypothetical protein